MLLFVGLLGAVWCERAGGQTRTVVAWGDNSYSECDVPTDLTNVVTVSAGPEYNLAVLDNGTLRDWGGNGYSPPPGLIGVEAGSERGLVGLALFTNGTVAAWGNNSDGSTNVPAGLSNVIAIASGTEHGLALKADGTVVGWGGQDNTGVIPSGINDAAAIAAGLDHSLILRSNGTVVAWGWNIYGITNVPAGLSNVVAISAGDYHSMALKNDGTVVVWGGQTSDVQPPAGLNNVVSISAGAWHNLALKQDGTVVAWGDDSRGATDVPVGLSNVVAVSAGRDHSVAITTSQVPIMALSPTSLTTNAGAFAKFSVRAFGPSLGYQWQHDGLDIPGATDSILNLVNAQSIDAGNYQVVVSNSFGSVTSGDATLTVNPYLGIKTQPHGQNGYIGNSANFNVVATGSQPFSYQWTKDNGTLAGATSSTLSLSNLQTNDAATYRVIVSNVAGSITSSPASLTVNPNPAPVVTQQPASQPVFQGERLLLGVSVSGSPPLSYQWRKDGASLSGQNGTNLLIASVQSTDIGSYTVVITNTIAAVTSGPAILTMISNHSPAVIPGTVVGLGGLAVPAGLTNVIAVDAGFGQQLAVRSDGTVVCWGNNVSGSPQPPADLSNVVAVASGGIHSIAVKSDGTVVGWGLKADPPGDLFGVVAIASGHDHSIALKADGTTVSWGGIAVPPPAGNTNFVAIAAGDNFNIGLRNDGTVPADSYIPMYPPFNGASNVMAIAAGTGENTFVTLGTNGEITGWNISVPAGLSNVVAISRGLALKNDGSVVGLEAVAPPGLTNVIAISGTVGNGLVITTNPPSPTLAATTIGGDFKIYTPVSVPGYVLEASDNFAGPFVQIDAYTNATTTNGLTLPASGSKQYYRLHKR